MNFHEGHEGTRSKQKEKGHGRIKSDSCPFVSFVDTTLEKVVEGGVEPPTLRFSVACSTN